jgi:hypothetical protein
MLYNKNWCTGAISPAVLGDNMKTKLFAALGLFFYFGISFAQNYPITVSTASLDRPVWIEVQGRNQWIVVTNEYCGTVPWPVRVQLEAEKNGDMLKLKKTCPCPKSNRVMEVSWADGSSTAIAENCDGKKVLINLHADLTSRLNIPPHLQTQ